MSRKTPLISTVGLLSKAVYISCIIGSNFFFYMTYLHVFKQKNYGHQVLIHLNVPGIPVKKPLQNSKIVEEQPNV